MNLCIKRTELSQLKMGRSSDEDRGGVGRHGVRRKGPVQGEWRIASTCHVPFIYDLVSYFGVEGT